MISFKFILVALAIVGGFYYWRTRNPYAGLVATGWGGNATGNSPSLLNPTAIVGFRLPNMPPIYGSPSGSNGQPDLGVVN